MKTYMVARDRDGKIVWVKGRTDLSPFTHREWHEMEDMITGGSVEHTKTKEIRFAPFTFEEENVVRVEMYVGRMNYTWYTIFVYIPDGGNIEDTAMYATKRYLNDNKFTEIAFYGVYHIPTEPEEEDDED